MGGSEREIPTRVCSVGGFFRPLIGIVGLAGYARGTFKLETSVFSYVWKKGLGKLICEVKMDKEIILYYLGAS